jgi:hypothetical protein
MGDIINISMEGSNFHRIACNEVLSVIVSKSKKDLNKSDIKRKWTLDKLKKMSRCTLSPEQATVCLSSIMTDIYTRQGTFDARQK